MSDTLPLPPGRLGLPIVGESPRYLRAPASFMAERQQQYGDVFKTHLFGTPTIVLIGADAVRFLFANESDRFEMTNTRNLETLLGINSIGVKTGAAHQTLRRQLFQAFQPRILADYAPKMAAIISRYLQSWENTETLTWYPELKKINFGYRLSIIHWRWYRSRRRVGKSLCSLERRSIGNSRAVSRQ